MENKKDSLGKIESISTIIVNIGTMVSWVLTIFTAFVLTTQTQPITLPGLLELNAPYKLLFLSSVLLGYIQLLRRQWENQKRVDKDIEGSFGSYLFGSLLKFRRPLVLVGFLIILTIIGVVISTEVIGLGITILLLGIPSLVIFLLNNGWEWMRRQFDDDFRKRWLKRIRNQLYQNGYTYNPDFVGLAVKNSEVNWALEMYFNKYEFEQDLLFTQRKIERVLRTVTICEVRFKHVPSRLAEFDSE